MFWAILIGLALASAVAALALAYAIRRPLFVALANVLFGAVFLLGVAVVAGHAVRFLYLLGIFWIGLVATLAVALVVRRKFPVLAALILLPFVLFLAAYVPGQGFDNKATALIIHMSVPLVIGGLIGIAAAEVVRYRREQGL